MVIIEICDANVRVSRGQELLLESPGYAIIREGDIEVGAAAFNQARLYPRQAQNQFWYRLNLEPLTQGTDVYRHNADLAFAHLKEIAARLEVDEEVVFAVPGHYSNEQLSLLLGLAQKVPLKVVGLVDYAIAAAAGTPLRGPALLLDIQLHQALLTSLSLSEHIARSGVEKVADNGLIALTEAWIQQVAEAFVRQSRFDPLHSADTEQALYRNLPNWLDAMVNNDEVLLEIESTGKIFQARLQRDKVIDCASPFYQKLAAAIDRVNTAGNEQILVTERLAKLPGLQQVLPAYQRVAEHNAVQACLEHQQFICGEQDAPLSFITALPLTGLNASDGSDAETVVSAAGTAAPEPAIATHILQGHRVFPLQRPLYLGADDQGRLTVCRQAHDLPQLGGTVLVVSGKPEVRLQNGAVLSLNGRPVNMSSPLVPGDVILLEGAAGELAVIHEVEDGP